jgi:hypothetical protein
VLLARGQHLGAARRLEALAVAADEVDGAVQVDAVDLDLDEIAVAQLADRAARERLGADVADAGARRDAREARVGEQRTCPP